MYGIAKWDIRVQKIKAKDKLEDVKIGDKINKILDPSLNTSWYFLYLKSPTSEQEMVRNALIFIQLSFFTYLSRSIVLHTTYSWNIKWQKCAGMGLSGFIFKKINENENIKTKKNPGSCLGVSC